METSTFKDVLTTILERKSVRNYTGDPVSNEEIDKLLRAAMAAPTAIGMMPWRFIVVTEPTTLRVLSEGLPFAKMLITAGACIVVCAVAKKAAGAIEEFAVLDCSCASENILLAAEALGLGAVWTAVYPNKALIIFVRKTLNIPNDVIPLNVIPVGHPSGEEKPKDKYDARNIHWQKW